MIIGVGIDIIDVTRVKKVIEKYGSRFIERIFTGKENAYCDSKAKPYIFYAARFAAKEAFLKALGSGLSGGIKWKDIEIDRDNSGKPYANYSGRAKQTADNLGVEKAHLSMAHTSEYAVAIVELEGTEKAVGCS